MNPRQILRTVAAVAGLLAGGAAQAELYVIAHPSAQVTPGDIRDIFVGNKQFAGGTKLVPIDNGPVQEAFLATALKMEASRYNTIWTKKSFREGMIPPTVKSGDIDVLEFVKKMPGAVGYVSSPPPTSVTIIHIYHTF